MPLEGTSLRLFKCSAISVSALELDNFISNCDRSHGRLVLPMNNSYLEKLHPSLYKRPSLPVLDLYEIIAF